MKTFKNKNFIKRDYECTNIIACQSLEAPLKNSEAWIECDESILNGLMQLWIENEVKYFGHL